MEETEMNMSSLTAKSLILTGSAMTVLVGLSMPSQAKVMTAAQFLASMDEVKYVCRRLDEPFWLVKRQYGCGDQVSCRASGACEYHLKPPKKRRPNDPPLTHVVRLLEVGPDSNDHDGIDTDHDGFGHDKGDKGQSGNRPR
jgi:hypothetical protein